MRFFIALLHGHFCFEVHEHPSDTSISKRYPKSNTAPGVEKRLGLGLGSQLGLGLGLGLGLWLGLGLCMCVGYNRVISKFM